MSETRQLVLRPIQSALIAFLLAVLPAVAWTQPEETPTGEPQLGTLAPDFTLDDTSGRVYRLGDFRGRKPVVVIFASSTSRTFLSQASETLKLIEESQSEVEFLIIYTKETEPGLIAQERWRPKTYADRLTRAVEFAVTLKEAIGLGLGATVLVDAVPEKVLPLYGNIEEGFFIVDRVGRLSFIAEKFDFETCREEVAKLRARGRLESGSEKIF